MAASPRQAQVLAGPAPPSDTAAPFAAAPARGPWHYLDEGRTHEVHAHVVREGAGYRFVTREVSPPARAQGASPVFESDARFQEPWEAKFHRADLEGRLATLGRYWRHEPPRPGWTFVHRNPAVPRVDLRGLDLGLGGASFHAFHHGPTGRDRLLVALPRRDRPALALADLDFEFPLVEEGRFTLLHPCLPPVLARSVLAREHIGLRRGGFDKLTTPADFALVHGPQWRERVQEAFRAALRLVERPPPPVRPAPRPAPLEGEAGATDFAHALTDPRLLAVHARFLRPGEEDALMRAGEPGIRRAVAAKRRAAAHVDQHRLSALEASLLARHAIATRSTVDPEAARILRRLDLLL